MKKIFIALLLLVTTACAVGAVSSNDNVLVIGLDDNFAPMGFRDERGNIVGFDVDLAKETAKRMDVTFRFKAIDWNDKERELDSGNIDLIWNALDITPERREQFLFSKPYMETRQIILVKKGNTQNIHSEGSLEGKRIGTQTGSSPEDYLKETGKGHFAEFKTYDNFKDAFKALDDDEVDALVCDEVLARYEINQDGGKFEVIGITVGPFNEIGIGFRKGDVELRDQVQAAFDEVVADGTARKISEKWFSADLIKFKK